MSDSEKAKDCLQRIVGLFKEGNIPGIGGSDNTTTKRYPIGQMEYRKSGITVFI